MYFASVQFVHQVFVDFRLSESYYNGHRKGQGVASKSYCADIVRHQHCTNLEQNKLRFAKNVSGLNFRNQEYAHVHGLQAEYLSKLPMIQHFLFGSLLDFK